jgi:hypothetical protein
MAIKVSGTTVIDDNRALQNITDIPNISRQASITSPANGSTDTGQGKFITIDVSPYEAVFGVAEALQVQIDNNSDFSSPLYDVETVTSGSEVIVDGNAYSLPGSTLLYVRARYKDGEGTYANWTPTISFTTRSAFDFVNTPSITSPTAGQTVDTPDTTISASAFSTSGGSYTHTSSDWQISTNSAFTTIAYQSLGNTGNKTSITPSGLNYSSTYYVRVRYNSSIIGDSEWSDGVSYNVGAQPGEQVYTTPGTFTFVAPSTENYSVVVVGGGGGGGGQHDNGGSGGGALAWKNNIGLAAGSQNTVVVGAGGAGATSQGQGGQSGGQSYFISPNTVSAGGGVGGSSSPNPGPQPATTSRVGDGGGNGGGGTDGSRNGSGGAGGYSGNGGTGRGTDQYAPAYPEMNGSGGGGGASGNQNNRGGGGAGGVGLFGQGPSGSGATSNTDSHGKGGSSGAAGFPRTWSPDGRHTEIPHGGTYGGGGGSFGSTGYGTQPPRAGNGGGGAVRILWGGDRSFPNNAPQV